MAICGPSNAPDLRESDNYALFVLSFNANYQLMTFVFRELPHIVSVNLSEIALEAL